MHRILVPLDRKPQQERQRGRHIKERANLQHGGNAISLPQHLRKHDRPHDSPGVIEHLPDGRGGSSALRAIDVEQDAFERRPGDVEQHAEHGEKQRVEEEGHGDGEALGERGREENGE